MERSREGERENVSVREIDGENERGKETGKEVVIERERM